MSWLTNRRLWLVVLLLLALLAAAYAYVHAPLPDDDELHQGFVLGGMSLSLFLPHAYGEKKGVTPDDLRALGLINHPDLRHCLSYYSVRTSHKELQGLKMDHIPIRSQINQINQILTPVAAHIGFTVLPTIPHQTHDYTNNSQEKNTII